MWILLDLILVAVFLICVVAGYKKGFIKSCLGLVVTFLAIAITVNFYAPVGQMLRETVVYDNLKESLKDSIESHIDTSNNPETVSQLFLDAKEQSPEFERILNSFNFSGEKAAQEVDKIINEGKEFTVDIVCERIVEEASVFISDAAAIILVFLASVVVLNIIVCILDLIFKLPVLNAANRVLGFVIGAVKGILYIFVIIAAVRMALPYLDGFGIRLTEEDIGKTVVFSNVEKINIVKFD